MNKDIFNSKEYKISRGAYSAQNAVEYFIALCATDAFLANLLTHIGISDSLIGIISSLISLSFMFQLISMYLVNKIKSAKRVVLICNGLSQMLFMCLYILPFVPVPAEIKPALVFVIVLMAYFLLYAANPIFYKWANSFVHPMLRAQYGAVKEIISLVGGVIFSLAVGYSTDYFTATGNVEGGFMFTAIAIAILNVFNIVSILLIKKDGHNSEASDDTVPFIEVFKQLLGNKAFLSVVLVTMLAQMAQYTTIGFMGVYKTKDLMISVGFVQIISFIGVGARVLASTPFGRYADRRSFAVAMKWAAVIMAVAYFVNMFTTPERWYMVIAFTIIQSIGMAGYNANAMNIVYSYVDSRYIVQAMAIKNSICGICGFLAALGAGRLLAYIQSNGNTFLELNLYGQQVLSSISFLLYVIMAVIIKLVLQKQAIRKQ